MRELDRKLLRDLRRMWRQALTIALVAGCSVASFITSFSVVDSLAWTRDAYYTEARFAHIFANLIKAPSALLPELERIAGVAQVETKLSQIVPLSLPGVAGPLIGRLIGLDTRMPQHINTVYLQRGRLPTLQKPGAIEALVSERFALARQLQPGDKINALLNNKQETLLIVGVALSPEYIFAGLSDSPDQFNSGVFWVDHKVLAAAYNMSGAFNQVALRLAPGAPEGAVTEQLNRLLAPFGGTLAHGREQQISHTIINSGIREQQVLGIVLPGVFLLIAVFLLNITLGRLIAAQRELMTTLKALGYDHKAIVRHYLKLGLLLVLLGLLPGLVLGAALGDGLLGIYADVLRFPALHYRFRPELYLGAAVVTLGVAVLATLNTIRVTMQSAPAQAIRPPAPRVYQLMLIERWGWLRALSPASRMVLRRMTRRPLHTGLTIFGLAMLMAVVIASAFWRDAIAVVMDTQFKQVLRGDVSIALMESSPARIQYEVAKLPHVRAVEGARIVAVRLVHQNHSWHGTVQGKVAQPELHRIIKLDQQPQATPHDGLLLTNRLAERLQVHPGDSVRVELMEGSRETLVLAVTGITSEMMGMNAYLDRHTLNRLLRESDVINQLTVAVDRGNETTLLKQLKALPQIAAVSSRSAMQRSLEEVTARNIRVISAVLMVLASLIAIGVVYNNTRIVLAERASELASLRVLGFTRSEVAAFLQSELAIETVLAMPLGCALGYLLAAGIVSLIQTDEFNFPLVIQTTTYAYAALYLWGAGAISAWVVRRQVERLDLVGVLRTHE